MEFLTEKRLNEFLNYHYFILDADMFVNCDVFRKEMKAGLKGQPRSLKMLPSYISANKETERGECLVIDVGGTHIRASYYVNNERLERIDGISSDITAVKTDVDGFFGEIAECAAKLLLRLGKTKVQRTAFCFSYPTNMRNDLDGEVISLTKEISVCGIEGRPAAESLREAAEKKGVFLERIVVLNDTSAALLGGAASGKECDGRIGFIMGTGDNLCYEERTEKIATAAGYDEERMIINIESGNFRNFARSDFDRTVISRTEDVNAQLFEKMTAGRYLGEIFTEAMKAAVKEKILDCDVKPMTTEAMSRFLEGEESILPELLGESREFALGVARAIVERSVAMCSTIITAIMTEADFGKKAPALIAIEGSTYRKLYGFKESLYAKLKDYLDSCGRGFEIYENDELNDIGSAFAAFSCLKK